MGKKRQGGRSHKGQGNRGQSCSDPERGVTPKSKEPWSNRRGEGSDSDKAARGLAASKSGRKKRARGAQQQAGQSIAKDGAA